MATLETLQPRLRQLKLTGMLDSIAARVQEARARPLDPLGFLLLLVEDELVRARPSRSAYITRARFDEVCDLRDFDFTFNPEIPKARIWELASGRFVEEHSSVLLCGPTGVGKSTSTKCPPSDDGVLTPVV
jgi:DNA replication protein DnaC